MKSESRILNDSREIFGIYFNDEYNSCYTKRAGHTITTYAEPGIYGYITYFEVRKKAKTISRVPAYQVSVEYAP